MTDEPNGRSLYEMEQEAQARLDNLLPQREAETDKRARKILSKQIKIARSMRDWAKTRTGYVVLSSSDRA
jgi:vacuolar-type H+-ATPase subunit H